MIYKKYGISLDRTKIKSIVNIHTMHTHANNHELFFMLSGQRRYFVGHSIYDISPGNVIYIPKNVLHRTVSLGTKGYDRYVVQFPQKFCDKLIADLGWDCFEEWKNGVCFQHSADTALRIQRAFEKIEQEMTNTNKWSQSTAYFHLHEILLCCFKNGTPKERCQEETVGKIQEICKYISNNYREDITLEDASSMVHIEKTYFCKCFKKTTGTNFLEFLTQTRLQAAKELLSNTDLSVGEISDICGFSCGNYFGDVFKKNTGVSPKKYRQKAQQQKTP